VGYVKQPFSPYAATTQNLGSYVTTGDTSIITLFDGKVDFTYMTYLIFNWTMRNTVAPHTIRLWMTIDGVTKFDHTTQAQVRYWEQINTAMISSKKTLAIYARNSDVLGAAEVDNLIWYMAE